ncbi:zinc-ribbon domain-containing protein [uncultured Varibaculum sp.]|uniref:zinc-ribbon domain-containing protein n=1 Tax=uncultured Varibaculum sp. TaxID=413896 RepID=UPI00288A21FA|nr:zinc-ribbon domain-containing protein [uncultured Varibaculum sp.]
MRKKSLAETNPELAAEIHPDSDIKAEDVTAGSTKKPLWVCERGHTWRARVSHRTNSSSCPYCSGRKAIVGETDLATVNPELAKQVSPNSKIKATEVTAFSNKKVLWVCKRGHRWRVSVASRTNGTGCPYCAGQKVSPGFNDLATVNPSLASEVSPDSKIKATEITAFSNKKLLWKCSKDHQWIATVSERAARGTGCPYCSGRKAIVGENDLATVNPELAAQIHPDSDVKANEVTVGSDKKPLWVCKRGHTWQTTSEKRLRGDGCPYCSGRKILPGFNDLATVSPQLANQVAPESPIKANEVTISSGKKLIWRCIRDHRWERTVDGQSRGAIKGCPYCSGHRVLTGFNDLATINPSLAAQVHPNSDIKADEVTAGSNKKLLWVCDRNHSWQASVSSRKNGNNCPYCSGRYPVVGKTDLATVNPKLAREISPNSKIKPTEVTASSGKKLLWHCLLGHEWLCSVDNRLKGRGCPQCAGSQAERDLAELVKSLLPEHIKILRNDRKVIKPYELDILVPGLNLAFEFNGTYWHSDEVITKQRPQFESSKAFDDFKKTECAKQGIKLFFVREKPWTENHDKEIKRIEKIVATSLRKVA